MNRERVEWAIRQKQPMPLVCKVERITPAQYRQVKAEMKARKKHRLAEGFKD